MKKINLWNSDCLELMKKIPDKSINLVLIDPPYNIKIKGEKWDNFKTVSAYVEFMGKVFIELERVLKDNGSFYFFHNDFLQIVELQNWLNRNSNFIFKQFIVWNKRFNGAKKECYFNNVLKLDKDRNYRTMAEYCLFYTFQDETGRKKVDYDVNNYKSLREYAKIVLKFINVKTPVEIYRKMNNYKAMHFFTYIETTQFTLPTKETYQELINVYNIDKMKGFKTYEELRQEYEELRQEYESQRYTFNNLKTHHSVWNYNIAPNIGHPTSKPVDLMENIIKHSSNDGDVVLDCFMGSGSTGIACINTNRKFIGIEKDEKYFQIAKDRINKAIKEKKNDKSN